MNLILIGPVLKKEEEISVYLKCLLKPHLCWVTARHGLIRLRYKIIVIPGQGGYTHNCPNGYVLQVKIWLQLLLVFISRFLNGNGQLSKEAKIHISVYSVYFAKSNALISGHQGRGVDPREPPVICTSTFTNPSYPKPRFFDKKLLTPLP